MTDFEWRVIEPLLPNKPRDVPRVDDRRVLNGIFGCFGPVRLGATCLNDTVRAPPATIASLDRTWDRMMDVLTAAHDGDIQMIDSTSVRAHQQAATAKRGIEIIVSVVPEGGSRQKSTRSSKGKASHPVEPGRRAKP